VPFFGSTSTVSRIGERFRSGQSEADWLFKPALAIGRSASSAVA